MRVLFVADFIGGMRTFTCELVGELARRDVEVHLALIGPGEAPGGAASCEVRARPDGSAAESPALVATMTKWVEERRVDCDPDIIHMNTFAPVLDPDVPVVLTAHSCRLARWNALNGAAAPADLDPYRALARRSLRRADAIVAPTRAALEAIEVAHGALPQARIIHCGRDVGLPAPAMRGRESLVVAAGPLADEARNAAVLAAVAHRIDGHMALIGPGELDGAYEPLGELHGREVLAWFSRAAVYVSPARYEPFGISALEAALCGCALVLADIPSHREVWGDAAAYVHPDDATGLVRTINALLRDPLRRAAVARRAYETARRYHPVAMADRYLAAYRGLIRERVAA